VAWADVYLPTKLYLYRSNRLATTDMGLKLRRRGCATLGVGLHVTQNNVATVEAYLHTVWLLYSAGRLTTLYGPKSAAVPRFLLGGG